MSRGALPCSRRFESTFRRHSIWASPFSPANWKGAWISCCTIINVQGRKSRRRSADDVEKAIREHLAEGLNNFFITDDNFARNKDWEAIFDRLIELRERDKLNI